MAAVLDDVAPGIAPTEPRGNGGRSKERQIDLAAVSVAGECQRNAVGDFGKDVGVVGEGDCGDALGQASENGADVGLHLPEIADPGEPEIESFSFEAQALVLEDPDAGGLQGSADPRAVVPVVVIAEDREHAKRRLELREDRSGRFRRNEFTAPDSGDDVVSGEENEVGPSPVDEGHDLLTASPFLRRTGQTWKSVLGFSAEAISLFCVFAALQGWLGNVSSDRFMFIVLGAIAIGIGGFVGQVLIIRCPKCKTKLLWHAVSAREHPSGLDWFFSFVECPVCRFEPTA